MSAHLRIAPADRVPRPEQTGHYWINRSPVIAQPDQRDSDAAVRSGALRGDVAAGQGPQTERITRASMFEVFVDEASYFWFRLKAPDGANSAVSAAFNTKSAPVTGIAAVRECAPEPWQRVRSARRRRHNVFQHCPVEEPDLARCLEEHRNHRSAWVLSGFVDLRGTPVLARDGSDLISAADPDGPIFVTHVVTPSSVGETLHPRLWQKSA